MNAVIDRIIDGKWAVFLVGEGETEYNVELESLPEDAKEGSQATVKIENGAIVSVEILETETKAKQADINEKMKELKARKRSNFKR